MIASYGPGPPAEHKQREVARFKGSGLSAPGYLLQDSTLAMIVTPNHSTMKLDLKLFANKGGTIEGAEVAWHDPNLGWDFC